MATDWHAPAPESWEYNLATYFLLNGVQGDYFVGDAPNELPPTLWPGYAIKLGELDRRARTPKRRHLAAQICWRRGLRRRAGRIDPDDLSRQGDALRPLGRCQH